MIRFLKQRLHIIKSVSSGSATDQSDFYHAIREPKHLGGVQLNSEVIHSIVIGLQSFGYRVRAYKIDVADYRAYFEEAAYQKKHRDYYSDNLPEKSLEHYIAARLLDLKPGDVYIDIASEGSPVPEIYHRLFGCTTYRQDLAYPPGVNGDTIGGDAANLPVPDGFASKMGLHCSFEHFEGDSDIGFIKEASRVLRPGGAVCIVPLYLFSNYIILTDPDVSVPQKVQFEEDAVVHCVPKWNNRHGRFYDPVHLIERVHNNLNGMTMTICRITNAREVAQSCYVEFAALITKP
jgi:SAM-dependent methyltransferase